MCPHLAGRDVARIDRREPRGEQFNKRRLRALQVKSRLLVASGRDFLEVQPPRFARIDPQLLLGFALHQIEGAFDIRGG